MPLFVYPERDGLAVFFYAIGAFGRWLWRYRSELAPVYWTLGTVAVGAWLRAVHPHAWPIPAVVGFTAAVFLATVDLWPRLLRHRCFHRLPERFRSVVVRLPVLKRRRTERLWGAAVCASIGGWLTAATLIGLTGPDGAAGTRVLRWLALLGVVGLGLPWWYSRDRRRLVRVRRVVEHFPETAEAAGLPGARIVSVVLDRWGWTGRVTLRRGQHSRQVVDAVPALESALGTRVGAVRVEPVPSDAAEVVLRVVETDPHADPIPWPGTGHAGSGSGSVRRPVTLGVWEDGSLVRVSLLRRHVLIGGTTGSGKSGLLSVILAGLSGCADVVLWGVDLKEGMELRPWARCLGRLATTPPEATELLRGGVAELERRAALLADRGEREWQPAPSAPALVIVIDEYAELPKAARLLADSIARRGRAVAVTLLVATQRPTQKAMGEGSAIRSQMDVRICLRVRERSDVDLVLGQGMLTAGWDTTGFDAPGKFQLSAPGQDTPRRARGYLITDQQVEATATRHAVGSVQPVEQVEHAERQGTGSQAPTPGQGSSDRAGSDEPTEALWRALSDAPDHGVTLADLMRSTGKKKTWVYDRLKEYAQAGRVQQTYRGRWRSTRTTTDTGSTDTGSTDTGSTDTGSGDAT